MHKLSLLILSIHLLLITSQCEAAAFLSKWLLSPVGRRQNPGSLWQCPALPPDMTYCSHAKSSPESVQEANVWITLLSSRCHSQTMKFVCTVYNPVCLHSHQVMPILPCREFCAEVQEACISRMYLFGFKWPQQFTCDRFPSEETSMCVSSKSDSVACTPCNQERGRENIIKQYCQADIVVKSQISGVSAFGNTSSLLVGVDRISEQLLPQPSIPTPTNTRPNNYLAPLTGFVDTNDERFLMLSKGRHQRQEIDIQDRENSLLAQFEQADQPNNHLLATTPGFTRPQTPMTNSTEFDSTTESVNSERKKHKREGRFKGRLGRRRRDRRSLFSMGSSVDVVASQSMLLECAGCSLQLPTSPMAPNSATRWLVMAKKLNRSRLNLNRPYPAMQITAIIPWQKDAPGFRDALRDIRTIPRDILCSPNTKVELNLDGFHRVEQTTPSPPVPVPQREPVRTSWSRQGWVTHRHEPTPSWNLPPHFEGLFQNDAAAGTRKAKKSRKQNRRNKVSKNQPVGEMKNTRAKPHGSRQEKELRKRRRKERLAKMTPQQREAWEARRRNRRAQRQKMRGLSQQRMYNQTMGSPY